MNKLIKSIVVLVSICAIVAILMAMTNYITAPIIKENEEQKTQKALLDVLPDGGSFEKLDISAYELAPTVTEIYKAANGGYVVKLETTGYAKGMVIMCGVSADGRISGTKLVSSAETPSIGGEAAEALSAAIKGKWIGNIDGVDTVSGATKTTLAYRNAIKDALYAVAIVGGGSADTNLGPYG